ncbi:hypothetical protein L204_105510 [Cryptococcus depauperatus]
MAIATAKSSGKRGAKGVARQKSKKSEPATSRTAVSKSQKYPASQTVPRQTRASARLAARGHIDAAQIATSMLPKPASRATDTKKVARADTVSKIFTQQDIDDDESGLVTSEEDGSDVLDLWKEAELLHTTEFQDCAPHSVANNYDVLEDGDVVTPDSIMRKRRRLSIPLSSQSPPPTDLRTPHFLLTSARRSQSLINRFFSIQGHSSSIRGKVGLFRAKSMMAPPEAAACMDVFQSPIISKKSNKYIPLPAAADQYPQSSPECQSEESVENPIPSLQCPVTRCSRVEQSHCKPYVCSDYEENKQEQEVTDDEHNDYCEAQADEATSTLESPIVRPVILCCNSPSIKWRDPFSYIPAANTQSAASLRNIERSETGPQSTTEQATLESIPSTQNDSVVFRAFRNLSYEREHLGNSISEKSDVSHPSTSTLKKTTYGKGRSHTYKAGMPDPLYKGPTVLSPPLRVPTSSAQNAESISHKRANASTCHLKLVNPMRYDDIIEDAREQMEKETSEVCNEEWLHNSSPTSHGPMVPLTSILSKKRRKRAPESDSEYNPEIKIGRPKTRNGRSPKNAISPRLRLSRTESCHVDIKKYVQVVNSNRPKRRRRFASTKCARLPSGFTIHSFGTVPFSEFVQHYREQPSPFNVPTPGSLLLPIHHIRRKIRRNIVQPVLRRKLPNSNGENVESQEDEIVPDPSMRSHISIRRNKKARVPKFPKLNLVADSNQHQIRPRQGINKISMPSNSAHVPGNSQENTMDFYNKCERGAETEVLGFNFRSEPLLTKKRPIPIQFKVREDSIRPVTTQSSTNLQRQDSFESNIINLIPRSVQPKPQEEINVFASPINPLISPSPSIRFMSTQGRSLRLSQKSSFADNERYIMNGMEITNHLLARPNRHAIQSRKERQEARERRLKRKKSAEVKQARNGLIRQQDSNETSPSPNLVNETPARSKISISSSAHVEAIQQRAAQQTSLAQDGHIQVPASTQVRPLSAHPTPSRASLSRKGTIVTPTPLRRHKTLTEIRPLCTQTSSIIVTRNTQAPLHRVDTQHSPPPLGQGSQARTTQTTTAYDRIVTNPSQSRFDMRSSCAKLTQGLEKTEIGSSTRAHMTQELEKTEIDPSSRARPTQTHERIKIGVSSRFCYTQGHNSSRSRLLVQDEQMTNLNSPFVDFRSLSPQSKGSINVPCSVYSQDSPEIEHSPTPPPLTQTLQRLRSRSLGSRSIGLRVPQGSHLEVQASKRWSDAMPHSNKQTGDPFSQFQSPLKKGTGFRSVKE